MSQLAFRSQTIARGHPAAFRYVLGGLLAFGALNAFGGGYYGMSGAEGVPKEWLEGSLFDDYFIPSLILFVAVGGSLLAAAIAVFAGLRLAHLAATAAGVVVLGWLAVETLIIGYVSWMQPATTVGALMILLLARLQPNRHLAGVAHVRTGAVARGPRGVALNAGLVLTGPVGHERSRQLTPHPARTNSSDTPRSMEHLWSRAVATNGNRWQMGRRQQRRK